MKALITGGAGFIGSHIADLLIEQGISVAVVDNLSTGRREYVNERASLYEADICDRSSLSSIFRTERPDVVIHHAAQIDVKASIDDPVTDAEINLMGTVNVLHCSSACATKKVIYASSAAVYGVAQELPIRETAAVHPQSFYGLSKLTPERYLAMFSQFYGLDYTVLRYANVYGIRQDPKGEGGVVSVFLSCILQQQPIVIHGDGQQTRDFIYVRDIAQANLAAITHGSREILNVSSNTTTSIRQLATMMQNVADVGGQPLFTSARQGDILHSRLDNTLACTTLDWCPEYSLAKGLQETMTHYLKK